MLLDVMFWKSCDHVIDTCVLLMHLQGNMDPAALFGSKEFIEKRIHDTVAKAGRHKHIMNLGHGVLVGTPEENVAHFFEISKSVRY